ncbi:hypothetical protein [Paludisphaera borealis]|uniref:Lipoprotein n=1 Tax=Paludisphaera borealis TaxID=1387353 RepID=A0A1U7CUR3_9BACT|nr:hypothetical protein [Paludisphaera borealis]APW62648.1 hypothetical protein BSF38_04198 [Paludisphaera borealis]
MPSYRVRAALMGLVLAIFVSGCGGNDVDAPIEKSPYAQTPAQIDEMKANMMKTMKLKPPTGAAKK